jgi:hypothetical protein
MTKMRFRVGDRMRVKASVRVRTCVGDGLGIVTV